MGLPLPAFVSDLREDIILAMARHEVATWEAAKARRVFEMSSHRPMSKELLSLSSASLEAENLVRRLRGEVGKAMKALVDATGGLPTL